MKLFIAISLCVASVLGGYHEDIYMKTSMALGSIPKPSWKAQYHEQWAGQSRAFFQSLAGTRLDKAVDPALVKDSVDAALKDDLPRGFDSRQKWSQCSSLGHIRNQANCGSCWAVSAAEVASDRSCIKTGAQLFLSDENLMSCCSLWKWVSILSYHWFLIASVHCHLLHRCEGGWPIDAMYYWMVDGIPTGGDYGSHQGCEPYLIQPCDSTHHCSGTAKTPACSHTCEADYQISYGSDLHYADHYYYVNKTEPDLMAEIYENGPIQCAFTVYEDFYNYKSGVYQHLTGGAVGGHAIRVLGWGVESCQKYWLVANSWGTSWGEDGYFKIRRGNNECSIESQCVAGIASSATHQPVTFAPTTEPPTTTECAGEDTG